MRCDTRAVVCVNACVSSRSTGLVPNPVILVIYIFAHKHAPFAYQHTPWMEQCPRQVGPVPAPRRRSQAEAVARGGSRRCDHAGGGLPGERRRAATGVPRKGV